MTMTFMGPIVSGEQPRVSVVPHPERLPRSERPVIVKVARDARAGPPLAGEVPMLKSVEGVILDGQVLLRETPPDIEGSRVIVTFLPPGAREIDLRDLGIDGAQAADLRARLAAFAEDWDRPEMDVYDGL